MTRETVPAAGTGRHNQTRVPTYSALRCCHIRRACVPAPRGSDFSPPASGPVCVPVSVGMLVGFPLMAPLYVKASLR